MTDRVPPLLVLAVGNASRGDDALGPALLKALDAAGVTAQGQVELLEEYQLQVENALDLDGRAAVLFVDAALPGAAELTQAREGVALSPVGGDGSPRTWSTHALSPQSLLGVYARVQGQAPPPAWLLAIEGEAFELGTGLSPAAQARLPRALALALAWLADRAPRQG